MHTHKHTHTRARTHTHGEIERGRATVMAVIPSAFELRQTATQTWWPLTLSTLEYQAHLGRVWRRVHVPNSASLIVSVDDYCASLTAEGFHVLRLDAENADDPFVAVTVDWSQAEIGVAARLRGIADDATPLSIMRFLVALELCTCGHQCVLVHAASIADATSTWYPRPLLACEVTIDLPDPVDPNDPEVSAAISELVEHGYTVSCLPEAIRIQW